MAITQDFRSVMAQLRMMGDTELRQYAAMHKNDPFIFPLAFQESQMRQQVRNEAQAMQPPQPKVADQALASMAAAPMPEDVGIGALDAPNLNGIARGAAGGIVAFDEGGEVPRFDGRTGSVPGYYTDPISGQLVPVRVDTSSLIPQTSGYEGMGMGEFLGTLGRKAKGALGEYFSEAREKANAQAMYGGPKAPTKAELNAFGNVGGFNTPYTPAANADVAAPGTKPPGSTVPPGPALPPGPATPPRAAVPQQQLATTPEDVTGDLTAMRKALGVDTLKEDVLKRQQELAAAEKSAADEALEVYKRDIEKQGKGMEGAEARAQARGEKLAKREGDLTGMALLEAGMAIMAGSSPFALQNIGAGAQVGIKSYTAGIDKLQEARDKLDESYDKIEQYRAQREDMNARERRQFEKDIRQTRVDAEKRGIDALMQFGNMDRADAREGFSQMMRNRATAYEVGSRERLGLAQIAAHRDIAASQPDRVLWESLLRANNNDPTAAYQALTKLKTEKFNPYQSYADYLKAFAGKENVLTPPMGFTQYASQFAVPTYGSDALPGNAPTRPPIK